ncbi:mercuric reductase [Pedobacter quisquiliarum]|uniref:Mercuric reductase n=1 Tax=Pedobacter quisquiliarum TaxID=1834438 RepID=A0A916U3X8_9SPHI|nr:mercuric reductase [Pedobacter quisquiliarum]GGC57767.1 mercuric reductase [Pedobacter quisquiliarum]
MKHYDAIVIGSGQAGSPLCKELAKAGKHTAIIEKRFVGGTCINDGCTPTKTMIASAKAAHQVAHSAPLGVHIAGSHINMKEIKQRKDELVVSWRDSSRNSMDETENLDLIFGTATFTGHKTLSVKLNDGKELELTADLIFINAGTTPMIPEIEGLDEVGYFTSTTLLDVEEVPDHLLVIGGNYVALEFAQMFHRFGSKISLLERGPRIMAREDEDVSEELNEILVNEGLKIYTNSQAIKFERQGEFIKATITVNGTEQEITCSHILVATGRKPLTATLAPEVSGIQLDEKGYIQVNEKLETNVKGVYALGDINGGPAFTHIAYNDYIIVYRNLFEGANRSTAGRPLPYCMFTDPQLGRIGLSEKQALEQGYNIKVAKLPMKQVARATETGQTDGFMKAVVDADTRQILGAAILAEQGGEVMSVIQLAMMGGLTYDVLRDGVFAHPTYSESLNNLFMTLEE